MPLKTNRDPERHIVTRYIGLNCHWLRTGWLLTLLSFLLPYASLGQFSPDCFTEQPPRLNWITSGVPDAADRDAVLLVETKNSRGRVLRLQNAIQEVLLDQDGIAQIRSFKDGYLVLRNKKISDKSNVRRPALVHYDDNFEHDNPFPLVSSPINADSVYSIYDYTAFEDGILAFGDIAGTMDPAARLFYVDDKGNKTLSQFSYHWSPKNYDKTVLHYTTNDTMRFLAAIEGYGFMLVLEDKVEILKVGLKKGKDSGDVILSIEKLKTFNSADFRFPRLYDNTKFTDAIRLSNRRPEAVYFEIFEQEDSVAGLFAGPDDNLYLLSKSAKSSKRGIKWILTKIDPTSGDILGNTLLPVPRETASLNVIPSEDFWQLLPKGPPRVWGNFTASPAVDTLSLISISNQSIRTMASNHDIQSLQLRPMQAQKCRPIILRQ